MDAAITRLALATAVGSALLASALFAALGGAGALRALRGMGFVGASLALFVGVVAASLAVPLTEARPYALAFLPNTVLRAQGLAEDPDLRTRYNVDARLRYLPGGGTTVVDIESRYAPTLGGFRQVEIPPVVHGSPSPLPPGVVSLGDAEFGHEIDGLYERAWATLEKGNRDDRFTGEAERTAALGTASVGFLILGTLGLVAGLLALLFRTLGTLWDGFRLVGATSGNGYRGVRSRALGHGVRELARWHFREARPFVSLATFGLLAALGGVVLGLLREDATRSLAHAVFREARDLRIERR